MKLFCCFQAFKGELTLTDPIFGLYIDWQLVKDALLLPAVILGLSIIIGFALNSFLKHYINTHLDIPQDSILAFFLAAIKGLPRLWCFGIGVYWTIRTLNLPEPVEQLLSYALFAIIVFSITRVAARVAEHFVQVHTKGLTSTNSSSTLLSNFINLIVYSFGIVTILGYFGISIAPILTALGVGGLAVALGLQDSLSNLFSGLHLILSNQVRIGDHICLASGESGEVKDIRWRYTILRTVTNNTIIVPNKNIAAAILTNYDTPSPHLAVVIPVGVDYGSDLDRVEEVTLEVARAVMLEIVDGYRTGEIEDPKVFFHTFGDSSINFNVILHAKQLANQNLLKHRFIKELTKRYREEGIVIPYPIRTIIRDK